MTTIRATAEQIPPDTSGTTKLATHELSSTGETYSDAKASLEAQVPAGWRLIHIRSDYYTARPNDGE